MNTKGHCYPKSIILQVVYFKLRFVLSYRDVEEIMKIRGVFVDHATIQRWVYKFTPFIESEMKKKKVKVGASWRMDETYIKVKDIWCYLYRAVDKLGNKVDFLLSRKRQRMSAQSFLIKAISNNSRPRVININKSGFNTAAIKVYNKRSFSKIKIRQCKYGNNIVEQDHRFIKWHIKNGLGFKSFESARRTLGGIEVVHMLRKNQMIGPRITMFKSFCKLAC
ncbi:IS6 family transposase [Flavobacterium sp. Fl-77]|jgi:putative transposase|uniref:IS6 family transposase n=1 Tax=Flavobacterium flavipigmentatum TaxID=2893884 RepID=A0AAJ2SJ87_9FLAO|nr:MULTISPECIES: IS6 family transposase [unclassified Flavobacterium]MDX6183963.1 IS6 family transposase [Flavobacterium sp. Fl-33]MDX6187471.1 IS6 family transposase [Flavobacterium sp. Fl-77]UFH37688.1 IS6 family transposase [Flavobacterium sp. F-70]